MSSLGLSGSFKLSRDETLSELGLNISVTSEEIKERFFALMKETALLLRGIVRGEVEEDIRNILKEEYGMSGSDASRIAKEVVAENSSSTPSKNADGEFFGFGEKTIQSLTNEKLSFPSHLSSKTASASEIDKVNSFLAHQAIPSKSCLHSFAPMCSSEISVGLPNCVQCFESSAAEPKPISSSGLQADENLLDEISSTKSFSAAFSTFDGAPSSNIWSRLGEEDGFTEFPKNAFGEKDQALKGGIQKRGKKSKGECESEKGDESEDSKDESRSDESSSDESDSDSSCSSSASSSSSEGGKGKEGYKENKKPVKGKMRGPLHFLSEETSGYDPTIDEGIQLLQKERLIRVNRASVIPICLGNPFSKGIWRVDLLLKETFELRGYSLLRIYKSDMKNAIKKRDSSLKPKKQKKPKKMKGHSSIHATSNPFASTNPFAPSNPFAFASSANPFASTNPFAAPVGSESHSQIQCVTLDSDGILSTLNGGMGDGQKLTSEWNSKGSQVACEVNTKKKTASFFVNRKKQPVLISKVPKCVQFQIMIHANGASVKVLRLDKIKKPTGPKKVSGAKNIEFYLRR
ncbi:uncharacterized protein MONOS_6016 [Monocercomonoides exilis]|uniref:uncharacterized protein n=1 Tax=Monocercomonoides exilis TaxID=2049356 RepID=UPI0035594106|nr:hypothetical protein MONOS_6016 [Monocercomonoides exilis]|eukprot:MONOS_6016.1-p1 / transcript=MONOS_6016.1 / gene=MONOS_6016 / organism=Monocercomonoides_exilis_PA203 / gene_product=unspecified product / transcript_product=unspecified product / location=Mono_scaffold00183:66387-68373(-) / protein_length=576 / sequence_SO=supercontig / SO=protein_coding / is_pseudo=false